MLPAARLQPTALKPGAANTERWSGSSAGHLVAEGKLPKDLGRALNDVQKLRRVGDYDEPGIPRGDAEEALARAREFVSAIERLLPG